MLLASAPFREWSLLSSRPTSRAHDRSLRQGNPTGREAGLDMHLTWRCISRSVPHFHAQFTQDMNGFTTQYVFTQCGLTAHLQSIETLICWLSFFNLQDVKLDQCRTPIKGCHSTMPTMHPWEIGDAPEHTSFASHHQAACWMPMLDDAKCLLDLERPIISRVHRTHTLWPRRHGEPPTIRPPEHNDDQPKPDLQDVRRWLIWIS